MTLGEAHSKPERDAWFRRPLVFCRANRAEVDVIALMPADGTSTLVLDALAQQRERPEERAFAGTVPADEKRQRLDGDDPGVAQTPQILDPEPQKLRHDVAPRRAP